MNETPQSMFMRTKKWFPDFICIVFSGKHVRLVLFMYVFQLVCLLYTIEDYTRPRECSCRARLAVPCVAQLHYNYTRRTITVNVAEIMDSCVRVTNNSSESIIKLVASENYIHKYIIEI